MLLIKESVLSFEEKTIQPWFTYLQIAENLLGLTRSLLTILVYAY